jgi:hypothetical protein
LRRQGTKGLNITREPEGQESFEAFGTREIGCSPDLAEGFKDKVGLIKRSSSSFLGLRLAKAFKSPEHSDRMLAVIPTGGTEFVEDSGFLFRGSFLIAEKDCFEVFLFRSWTHNPSSFSGAISGNIYYESTIPFYLDTR